MLKINALTLALPDNYLIINNLSLMLAPQEVHIILGKNGSGKSTLLNWLAGISAANITSGGAFLNNNLINNLPIFERARAGIHICPQHPPVISGLAQATLIKEMLASHAKNNDEIPSSSFVIKETQKLAQQLGLPIGYAARSLNEGYSGGERKKNEILQLMMIRPLVALIDEIDSGLDQDACANIASILKNLSTHTAMLIVTHSIDFAKSLNPKFVHVMKNGTIKKTGGQEILAEVEREGFEKL